MPKRKNRLIFILKFVFSFTVIALILIFKTSIKDIINTLKELNMVLLVLSFSLHAIGLFISAVRWQILIHAQDESVPLGFLVKSYLVGSFFNLFPSNKDWRGYCSHLGWIPLFQISFKILSNYSCGTFFRYPGTFYFCFYSIYSPY